MTRRTERIGEEIREEIAQIIAGELKDPRVGLVTVTRVDVTPAVKSGIPKGYARVHATPRERLAPLAPASKGAEVGKSLQLAEEPAGLQPGDVVWISDGHQPIYRRVEQVRGRRITLDAEIGELRADLTVVGRPIVLPVTDIGHREVKTSGNVQTTILAIRVAGDWTRLANDWLADVDSGFYVTSYLRSWAFEAQLRAFLREQFGTTWFARREAGSLLRELWSEGQRLSADELLKEVTGSTVEMESIAERVREAIR